ncbi:GntR family transcriptional regulator [Lachnoclostridium pacaense]|uniref:GntR family transcriptional regulator n=1 Tax=Enterocloster hominis (ex Hitch et al. 2024) TaxID=1917870 RepID=UPI001D125B29|nr:GntR family transcriptional regulator [Lachnoclostridium pacaense]MCC2876091.1 GntR family transcriptional regulator [Lachnoclostridium pacaense]
MKQGRASLIYQFFKYQIEFGYFQKGDRLPSLDMLCGVYHAALQTVRNAYLRLQEEGYIRISWGKYTVVEYDAPMEVCYQKLQDYYLAREESILCLKENLHLIMEPLLHEGGRRLQAKDMLVIKELAEEISWDSLYISFYCCRQMLLMLKNRLLLDLFYELTLFHQFPHTLAKRIPLPDAEQKHRALTQKLISACEQEDRDGLEQALMQIICLLNEVLCEFIGRSRQERPRPEPVTFQWRVYQEHTQKCYSVAAHLIGRVYIKSEYKIADMLPSYRTLADGYGVSFSTIRRVMDLLGCLGVVSSSQGLGAWVTVPTLEAVRPEKKPVQKILSTFLQALQILSISMDWLLGRFFPGDRCRVEACLACLKAQQATRDGFCIFLTGVGLVLDGNDGRPMKDIWDKFYEALLLCLPLLEAQADSQPELMARIEHDTELLIQSLEQEDNNGFADSLKRLMGLAESAARQTLSHIP